MFPLRARTVLAQLTPPVRRILAHSMLLGFAGSIADLLFNFYLVSLGYAAETAALLLAQTAVVPLLAQVTTTAQRPAMFGLNAAAALVSGLVGSAVGGLLPALAGLMLGSGSQDMATK